MKKALVGEIGRYAVHDGPGIRTTVFFKGCPLRCPWCHNPELIADRPEIAFFSDRCIGCGECRELCPEAALEVDKIARINRSRCSGCGLCVESCPTRALELVGRRYDVEELTSILLRDRLFYQASGGGVTLSGGEPTAQLAFCGKLLQRLHREGIHTAIETNGFFDWDKFEAICLPYLDLILFDVKIADSGRHREITGIGNEVILANLQRLLDARPDDVIARIPLIPGYTADQENITRLAALLKEFKVRRCSLLPYHPYGLAKAEKTRGKDNTLPQKPMNNRALHKWKRFFTDFDIVDP
ncbi:MAG: glycyl-radical enzyme activating protein [Desulfocapsaceae bacterium]|nr:glycyl-radical enzyme activating protein [Desulfocapsaceae bacterium]